MALLSVAHFEDIDMGNSDFEFEDHEAKIERDHEGESSDMPEKYTLSMSFAPPRVIHAALGRADSPIPQGRNEEESVMNLKVWLHGVVVGEAGAGVVRGAGGGDFARLESAQYH